VISLRRRTSVIFALIGGRIIAESRFRGRLIATL
jgi:hypothetical protein